ncbi:glycoside hydrolase family 88/105 protein [Chitinophaga nivalis]|uniref:Glycoside hydrolase family 88 protein n=1 Tax=Chitinophaga nivalis TaxID=2991709 RepID=A0ABT3IEB9_9BACT|nr:glycoside hydrolase family 88 protein [Chitinophaga nivalis]MCW3468009.1 glycoside hydrolase family 88 protein [Chitinophaga nivalis]MCW3482300.1 glycoside hydrolase family 88 protein [Chitinophaga nivalis]
MKKLTSLCLGLTLAAGAIAQPAPDDAAIVKKVADYVIAHTAFTFTGDNQQTYRKSTDIPDNVQARISDQLSSWHYPNGVLNIAMTDLGRYLNEAKYSQFAQQHIAFAFDNYQVFEARSKKGIKYKGFPFNQLIHTRVLDDCGAMGASVIDVYQTVQRPVYKTYIDKVIRHISQVQERLPDGTLCRPNPFRWTIWGDDLYMSIPFLARAGKLTGNTALFDDAVAQVHHFTKYLWDEKAGLYAHYYYEDLKRQGPAHWGRANGWIMMAKVQLLNNLPDNHPGKKEIIAELTRQILGVAPYQSASGLFHQVLDRTDSYTETSCTAMFVYAIARAVNEGWLDKRYITIAERGWDGIVKEKIQADGQLKDVCIGTNISADIAFYYNRPTELNDFHGLGPVIEAGIEIMRYRKKS